MSRAAPLPPDERRAQIIRVATPLVLSLGSRVTTREIAEAAGLAEGTLFRIFPTKAALLHEVILSTLDPTPMCDQISAINLADPLDERVAAITEVLGGYTDRISAMMGATQDHLHANKPGNAKEFHLAFAERTAALQSAIEAVLAPDADRLRVSPRQAAGYLRGLIFVSHHPMMGLAELSTTTILSLLLDGLRLPQEP